MKKIWTTVVLIAATLLAAAAASAEGLDIVCTNFPCYDFARAVAGGTENIRMLIKPGAEVHSYEPTPADIMALAECDLFIYIGGESDAWAEDMLASFGEDAPATLRMFDCVEAVAAEHDDDHHHEIEYDEHIWTSPVNASQMVWAISEKLCAIDGGNADFYAENAAGYVGEISRIDAQIREICENSVRNELIFADRFPFIYMAKEYGFEYASAFVSCSSESEPSAKTMMQLIERVSMDGTPVIYTIELSTQKTAQTIAEETGVEIETLHSVQTVSEADFAAGESYVSLMQRNVEALRKGLN